MTKIPLPPAPGTDTHVSLALANSAVALPGQQRADDLETPEDATRWLADRGLVPGDTALLAYCQSQLTDLRAHLRTLFAAQAGGEEPSLPALSAVNRALTTVPSAPLLRHDQQSGFRREQAHPVTQLVEYAMAQIAEDAAALLASDEAALITHCAAPPCDRYLLRTHARRHWCSTRCGDRVRAARAYARKRNQVSPA
ncbi:CGNR zinc finger domain-containing protein [Tomitella biformata]|uniref:CGNR zinc finger domain-containing protein n=1 Tax=Tomitella biformata TaxID=630403 RepID=UPI000465C8B0|nr:CGNR zinc finger domain-containing protein [Tomitella biformata]